MSKRINNALTTSSSEDTKNLKTSKWKSNIAYNSTSTKDTNDDNTNDSNRKEEFITLLNEHMRDVTT